MSRAVLLVSLFFLFLCSVPAQADLDQHCLAACISNSIGSENCLKQCSYNIEINPKPIIIPEVTLQSLEVHRTLPVPMPAPGPNEILPKQSRTLVSEEKDPICFSQCLKQKLQYDYCNEQCVKTPCPADVVLCPKQQSQFTAPK